MIEETPRPRKPKREVKPEPEIDRFDEGKPGASARDPLVTRCVQFYCSNQGLIISFLCSGSIDRRTKTILGRYGETWSGQKISEYHSC